MIPSTYVRCSTRKSSSTGRTVRTEPAIISSISSACSPMRLASATGRVYRRSSVSTIRGHMKSFQAPMKLNTPKVTRIGLSIGKMSFR